MSVSGGIALTAALALAAGGVVDVGGTAETRAFLLGDDAVGTAGIYSFSARPNLRAAIEHPRAAAYAQYAPSLSLVIPARQLLLALHTGSAGVELVLSRRLRLRARGFGAIGDLDPGTSQRELFTSLGVVDRARPLSYAAGNAELGVQAALSRAAMLDVTAAVSGVGSPSPPSEDNPSPLRTIQTQTLGARTTLALTRADGLIIDATLRNARVLDGGALGDETAIGVVMLAGYRRSLLRGAAVELRGGAWPVVADAADGKGRHLLVLPAADARASATLDLGGGSALVADGSVSLLPSNDPLGPLVESRAAAQLGLGARFATDAFLRGAAFLGAPAWVFGNRAPLQPGAGVAATFQWAFARDATFDVSAVSISRMTPREPEAPRVVAVEAAIACGVSGTFNLWHSGSRPRGSDPRPGRALEEREIGAARAPHQQNEPSSLPELPPVEEPPPPPPELAPPPVLPEAQTPSVTPSRKRRRVDDKKPAATEEEDDPRARRRDPAKGDDAATDSRDKEKKSKDDKAADEEKTP